MIMLGLVVAVAIALFAYAWSHDSIRALTVTPFILFVLNILARDLPPALALPAADGGVNTYAIGIVLLALTASVLGFVICGGAIGYRPSMPPSVRDSPVLVDNENAYLLAVLLTGAALASLALVFFGGLPPVAQGMLALIRGDASAAVARFIGESRVSLTKGQYLGGEYRGAGMLLTVMRVGWPFLLAMSLIILWRLRTRRWVIICALLFLLNFIFVAGDGTRGPFLWSLLYVFIAMSWLVRFRLRAVLMVGLAVPATAIAISLLSPKLQSTLDDGTWLQTGVARIGQRILLDNGANTVAIIGLVHEGIWNHRLGDVHLQRIRAAIPGRYDGPRLEREIFLARDPSSSAPTYASATYLGDVFLDFGILGVGIVYFVFGVVLAIVQASLFRAARTVVTLPLIALLVIQLGRISLAGPVAFLSQTVVGLCVFTLVWTTFIAVRTLGARQGARFDGTSPMQATRQ